MSVPTPALGTGVMRQQAGSVGPFGLKRASPLPSENSTETPRENKHVLAPTSRRAKWIDGFHALFSSDARYTWMMRREAREEAYSAAGGSGSAEGQGEGEVSEQASEHNDMPIDTTLGPPSASIVYVRYDEAGDERYLPQYYRILAEEEGVEGEALRALRVRHWREYHEEIGRKMEEKRVGVDGVKLGEVKRKFEALKARNEEKTRERQDL